jgi:hypothetical protein
MSVAPRWKRRADEIAEAIGDELSINGTVSIGNDVSLSVATISALALAIADVLNPVSIARAMWTSDNISTHTARAVYTSDGGGYWQISTLHGTVYTDGSPAFIYQSDGTTTISARSGAEDRVEKVNFVANVWQVSTQIVRNVSVLSSIQQPVHVELKNVTGGFTALGVNVSNAMKLSAQPISIASTVNVKTATNEAVAITGTVNANVGGVTLPISNPNNITVPVVNSANVTVPVNVGSATVPVRASANGTPQNSSGVNVLVSVNPTHSVTVPVSAGSTTVPVSVPSGLTVPASVASNLTVPVAVGGATVPAYVPSGLTVPASVASSLTVPVSVGSNTVPVAVGTATVPVAVGSVVVPVENTNNVTIPVTSSGTVLDVKIVEISAVAPSGGVAPTTAFHEAMETALEEADVVDVNIATIASDAQIDMAESLGLDMRGTVAGISLQYVILILDNGDGLNVLKTSFPLGVVGVLEIGNKVFKSPTGTWFHEISDVTTTIVDPVYGVIANASTSGVTAGWLIITDDGVTHTNKYVIDRGTIINTNSVASYRGSRVSREHSTGSATQYTYWNILHEHV